MATDPPRPRNPRRVKVAPSAELHLSPGPAEPLGELIRRSRLQQGMTQVHLAESLVAASGNNSLVRGHVGRWERRLHVPGPFWRSWLAVVLGLTCEQLEHAIVVQRHLKLQSALGIDAR